MSAPHVCTSMSASQCLHLNVCTSMSAPHCLHLIVSSLPVSHLRYFTVCHSLFAPERLHHMPCSSSYCNSLSSEFTHLTLVSITYFLFCCMRHDNLLQSKRLTDRDQTRSLTAPKSYFSSISQFSIPFHQAAPFTALCNLLHIQTTARRSKSSASVRPTC